MRHVRINDLARELGTKSKRILMVLPFVGIAGNKNHSSSLNLEEADSVRAYLRTHPVELPKPKRLQAAMRTTPRNLPHATEPSADCKLGKAQQRVTERLPMAKNAKASPGIQSEKRKKRPNKSRVGSLKRTKRKGSGSGISRIYSWLERGGWPYNS